VKAPGGRSEMDAEAASGTAHVDREGSGRSRGSAAASSAAASAGTPASASGAASGSSRGAAPRSHTSACSPARTPDR